MKLHIISRLSILLGVLGLVAAIVLSQSNGDTRQQAKEFDHTPIRKLSQADFKKGSIKDRRQPILEVTLHVQQAQIPQLSLVSTTLKEGFVPHFSKRRDKQYQLVLLNATGKVVRRVPFEIFNSIDQTIPLPGQAAKIGEVKLNQMNLVVNVPWDSNAKTIQVIDNSGNTVLQSALTPPTLIPATNEFLSAPAQPTTDTSSSLLGQILGTPSGPPPANYLDIVFISNGYVSPADFDQFHQQVTQMSNYLLTYEPFRSRVSEMRFSVVDNLSNLNCTQSDRLIVCDTAAVFQALNTVGVPYDKVIVVDNSLNYGGSGGEIAVTYNGQYQNQVFVHELGHTLGNLEDEYIKQAASDDPTAIVRVNCFRGAPPNPAWQGLVGAQDYHLGCNFPSWYRSSSNSLMMDITAEYFNLVSQRALSQAIDAYTTVPSPTATPVVGPTVCEADINQDHTVDLTDYSLLIRNLLRQPITQPRTDINSDNSVDLKDYSILVKFFLQHCT